MSRCRGTTTGRPADLPARVIPSFVDLPATLSAQVALEVATLHAAIVKWSCSRCGDRRRREVRREDETQGVDDVRTRLLARPTLAVHTGDLGDRRDDPAVFARLEDDGQCELAGHARNDSRVGGTTTLVICALQPLHML